MCNNRLVTDIMELINEIFLQKTNKVILYIFLSVHRNIKFGLVIIYMYKGEMYKIIVIRPGFTWVV